jgi:putative hydrolase of the HAD superfamily
MSGPIELVLFDVGGVLGSNGWDGEQRAQAVQRFGLDAEDFQYRHAELVGALESGEISLDEYLDVTVFCESRPFSRADFREFMFAQSTAWPACIAVVRSLARAGRARLATLNNESEELNVHRIELFGLRDLFPVFFSSCWLGVRKPTRAIYERVLGMTQARPDHTLFVDDRAQNLLPARALGMRTIQFENAGQLRAALATAGLLDVSDSPLED